VTSIESGPISQQPTDQAKRCSRTPLYVLGAILAFLLVLTYFDSTEGVEDFIKQTGGQLCWAYSSIEIYRAIFVIEDAVVAVGTIAVWVMIRTRYCLLSRITFVLVLGLLAVRWFWIMGDCTP
jgi:hypothetical protein